MPCEPEEKTPVYVTEKCDTCPFWNNKGCCLPLPVSECPAWQKEENEFQAAADALIAERSKLLQNVSKFIRELNSAIGELATIPRPTKYNELWEMGSEIDHVRFVATMGMSEEEECEE